MTCGIYLLIFKGTDEVYIGKSINIEKRFGEHLSSFRTNSASIKLQNAFNKYGQPTYAILCIETENNLDNIEKNLIEEFNSIEEGFNTLPSSNGTSGIYGEDTWASTHTNNEFISIFKELLKRPYKSHIDISIIFNVNVSLVAAIATGHRCRHLLSSMFPIEYIELMSLKGKRVEIKDKPSTTHAYEKIQYIEAIKLLVGPTKILHKEIANLTGINIDTIRDINSCRRHKWLEQVCPKEWQILSSKKQLKSKDKIL